MKSLSEFYVYKNGRVWNFCKECVIARQKYYNRVTGRDKYLAYKKSVAEKNRGRWKANYDPKVYSVQAKTRQAIKAGVLVRPANCQACGKAGPTDAHHHDYNYPLAVVFVCRTCHKQHHAMMDLINNVMGGPHGTGTKP